MINKSQKAEALKRFQNLPEQDRKAIAEKINKIKNRNEKIAQINKKSTKSK